MNTTPLGLVCVSVAAADAASVIARVLPVLSLTDVVEIRLDAMLEAHIAPCVAALDLPLLVTNRPQWEGGLFAGREDDRVDQLCAAVRAGARYADIELRTDPALRSQLFAVASSMEILSGLEAWLREQGETSVRAIIGTLRLDR